MFEPFYCVYLFSIFIVSFSCVNLLYNYCVIVVFLIFICCLYIIVFFIGLFFVDKLKSVFFRVNSRRLPTATDRI